MGVTGQLMALAGHSLIGDRKHNYEFRVVRRISFTVLKCVVKCSSTKQDISFYSATSFQASSLFSCSFFLFGDISLTCHVNHL